MHIVQVLKAAKDAHQDCEEDIYVFCPGVQPGVGRVMQCLKAHKRDLSPGCKAGMAASPTYVMGAVYATIPSGCATPNVQGTTYYLCGNTWFQPSYGANGVYYKVVPTP